LNRTPHLAVDAGGNAGYIAPMATTRNIVLLSDGTGNSRGKVHQTNVWRTYEALDLVDPAQPTDPRQFAFYDDGVGTSSFKPLALLGGVLGYGLARNVRDLYEFLCRTYRDGDRIYAFGFSRGAFTIRVLLGLICTQGLVPYSGNEAELQRLSKAAFRAYRRECYKLPLNWIALPRFLRDFAIDAWARVRGHRRYATVAKRMVQIEFVGLWDTVAAYGMPIEEIAIFINKVVWPLEMPNHTLNKNVLRAVHALALDDERLTFHPKLWDPDPGRIQQVWFAGMHSDVGGGYPDKGLAHVSLEWILNEAASAGLRLLPAMRQQHRALADENGPMNDSRHGVAGYYRYKPRELPARSIVHKSVLRRIQIGQDAYAPIVLPADFKVLKFDGTICDGREVLGELDMAGYEKARQVALNGVWLRRGVYFTTVGVTLLLLLLPVMRAEDGAACTTRWCWLSPALRNLQVLLPSALEGWAVWYAANPGTFLLLGGLAVAGLAASGMLQRWIFDLMRRGWYAIPAVRPTSLLDSDRLPPEPSALGAAIGGLRTSEPYRRLLRILQRFLLPLLAGVVMISLAFTLASLTWFAIKAADGSFCKPSQSLVAVGTAPEKGSFRNEQTCAPTGLTLQAGGTYDIQLTIDDPVNWKDSGLNADWRGVQNPPLLHKLAWLLKREWSQPIFVPLARIGAQGADVYTMLPDPSQLDAVDRTALQTRILARTTGELFLYLNDAAGPLWDPERFYRNNRGSATIVVRQVVPPQR
jgi:uncharacterized protein (DUF2235 family)